MNHLPVFYELREQREGREGMGVKLYFLSF